MVDPYGDAKCPYCGKPKYDTNAKKSCSGPSVEQMHANLALNLKLYEFRDSL